MPEATTARHYTRRPLEVAAVQWAGTNSAEMAALLGRDFDDDAFLDGQDPAGVFTTKHNTWQQIFVGEWALLAPGGSISVMDDDDFTAMFAEVGRG